MKKNLWDIKRAFKFKGIDVNKPGATMDATHHKGEYWILHIAQNGRPVPLYHTKDAQDAINYVNAHEW